MDKKDNKKRTKGKVRIWGQSLTDILVSFLFFFLFLLASVIVVLNYRIKGR